jgi:NADPH:quinone reductase-like Zn-dependent oxidoreductase
VQPGDVVLTLGTGGVSLAALQIARMLGARVAITSSSDEKLERARALGAEWTLNYRTTPNWGKALSRTIGEIDHVVEVGGAGTINESLRAVRMGGTLSLIGVLAGVQAPLALTKVLMRGVRIQGVFVGSRDDFESLNRALVARPTVRPVVGRTFAKQDLPEALAYLESQTHFGKVALVDS